MSIYPCDTPYSQTSITIYTKWKIQQAYLDPFTSCTFFVNLLTDDEKMYKTEVFIMAGNEYTDWGNNDQYLVNWINTQITYLTIPPQQPPETPQPPSI